MRTTNVGLPQGGHRKLQQGARTVAAVALGLSLVAACGDDSAGPEAGAATTSDLQELEQQIGDLEERIGVLEGGDVGVGADDGVGAGDEAGFFGDEQNFIGEEVTVSAEVSELITTTDVGSAFRIAGENGGQAIAVVSAMQPVDLDQNDVVRVTGTVYQLQRDSFEQDFGIAANELFEDEEGFFTEEEGSPVIAADRVEILQAQAGNGENNGG